MKKRTFCVFSDKCYVGYQKKELLQKSFYLILGSCMVFLNEIMYGNLKDRKLAAACMVDDSALVRNMGCEACSFVAINVKCHKWETIGKQIYIETGKSISQLLRHFDFKLTRSLKTTGLSSHRF